MCVLAASSRSALVTRWLEAALVAETEQGLRQVHRLVTIVCQQVPDETLSSIAQLTASLTFHQCLCRAKCRRPAAKCQFYAVVGHISGSTCSVVV